MKQTKVKFTVLVVDDDTETLKMIAESASKWGLEVLSAATVAEALQLLPLAKAVLADVNMPSGEKLSKELARVSNRIPVARFSGDPGNRLVQNYYLSKPFTKAELKNCLQHLLMMHNQLTQK